ncbi:Putative FBD-associated F-box protein [Striga hermonthica]|uniref:FBD-associated F-box protein n=1 Tax=Striga hermonthica TaxID=68872 RepID=A0A9N7MYB3_STRHE|nr:Putative FBD-associated F-box protein [Striga hermonthica]
MSGKSRELSIDRLSSLPDEVICHILSFLPTKLSVSTCVLAKRWRFLWAHVPVLDFQADFFETPNSDVINSVILQHKAKTMHTLRISGIECNEHQLEKWISTAVERKIRNLHIDFDVNSIALLHRTLFTCKTVVNMRLDLFKDLPSTGDLCLPSLKKLHLSHVKFEDDEALPHLLSGCPLLQELILDYMNDQFGYIEYDLRYINISSSTLKLLEVKMSEANDLIYRIVIDAPALRCLCTDCDLGRITILKDMVSLVEAEIRFDYCHDIFDIDNNESSNVVHCFNRLRNINCLKISSCEYLKCTEKWKSMSEEEKARFVAEAERHNAMPIMSSNLKHVNRLNWCWC